MKLSVATPSFRNSNWLKLCIASVADQKGVDFEHIVHDAVSDDGTDEWLPHDKRVTAYIEKDNGMYDAVNRAWKKATGDIVSYINCDEQYLPGALKAVHDYFETHPEIDVLVTDTVIVDDKGDYRCHRAGMVPLKNATWHRFNVLTCSLFIRRSVIEERNLYFDTKWKDLGDVMWLLEALRQGLRFGQLNVLTSAFTETGDNMNLRPNGQREEAEKQRLMPPLVKRLEPFYVLQHWLRTAMTHSSWKSPFDYQLYTLDHPECRVTKRAAKPTFLWVGRSPISKALEKSPVR